MTDEKMINVPIKMTAGEIEYIGRQRPNRSEFIRRLIHQHQDLGDLKRLLSIMKGQEPEGDAGQ